MPESQNEQHALEASSLRFTVTPGSSAEEEGTTIAEPGDKVDLEEIKRRMEERGIQVQDGRIYYPSR